MASSICPLKVSLLKEWLHEQILRPYLEAIERLIQAWNGVDFFSIYQTKLSFKSRLISLLIGIVLLIPFFNIIVWKGWNAFGHPEILSPIYANGSKEIEKLPSFSMPETQDEVKPAEIVLQLDSEPDKIKRCRYSETTKKGLFYFDWTEEHLDKEIIITENYPGKNTSRSRYSKDWHLLEYEYRGIHGDDYLKAWVDNKAIHVIANRGTKRHVRKFSLHKPYPFIQQPTWGFINFLRSSDKSLDFYGVHPEYLLFAHLVAKKGKIEALEGHGPLQKVTILTAGIPITIGELWFHPETHQLHKMVANSSTTLFCGKL